MFQGPSQLEIGRGRGDPFREPAVGVKVVGGPMEMLGVLDHASPNRVHIDINHDMEQIAVGFDDG